MEVVLLIPRNDEELVAFVLDHGRGCCECLLVRVVVGEWEGLETRVQPLIHPAKQILRCFFRYCQVFCVNSF